MNFLIIVLIILPTFLFCQTWERTYDNGRGDQGLSVVQTNDGGYIVTGSTIITTDSTNYHFQVYIIRTDNYGDTLWTKIYGGEDWDWGNSIQQTTDGGFIITGATYSPQTQTGDVYLIKTDENGDSLWTRTYGGVYVEVGNSVQQTTDEGYIITGYTRSTGTGSSEVYLIKTNNVGDTLWTKTFGGEENDVGYSVQQTTDGGYIITGYTLSFGVSNFYDIYLIKTDSNGDSLWTKVFNGGSSDIGYSVEQTTDGGYIISGVTWSFGYGNDDVYLIKTDCNGDTLWTKTFGGTAYESGLTSVQQTIDGGYIVTGSTNSFGNGVDDVFLIKTDSDGNTLWTRTFGGTGNDCGRSVHQTIDGGYIITGYTWSFGGNKDDVYLIKTDENGIVTSTIEILIPNSNRKLIKIIDILGKEITTPNKNQPFIEIYDDGSTEKKMINN